MRPLPIPVTRLPAQMYWVGPVMLLQRIESSTKAASEPPTALDITAEATPAAVALFLVFHLTYCFKTVSTQQLKCLIQVIGYTGMQVPEFRA